MYPELRPQSFVNSDLARYARLEGVDQSLLLPNLVEPSNARESLKLIRRQKLKAGLLDSLTQVKNGAELLSKPLDLLATSSTDASIAVLQHVVRKIDPYGKSLKPMPWELLWASRQTETQPGDVNTDFSKLNQNEAIVNWLVDGMFPLEALDEADKLYPNGPHGVGFKDTWLPHFEVVAKEQKYAWARLFVESAVDGTLTGLITALPAAEQSQAGLFKLAGLLATASISTKTTQKYNYLWGVTKDLAVDLRSVAGRYGQRSAKIKTNFDTAVNDMLVGSMNELNNRLSVLGIWTMLGSMALSATAFRLPKRGPLALVDGAIYAGLGAMTIQAVESGDVRSVLEAMSAEFGGTLKDITVQAENHENVAQLSHELVGSRVGVRELAEKRDLITFLKNVPTSMFVEVLPLVATSAAALLMGESFTSAVFSVGQVTRKAVGRMETFMSYKSGQVNRNRSRENLITDLKSLRTSVFGQLTNEALNGWLNAEPVDWKNIPHTLTFSQVGVPPYTRATDGSAVELVRFEEGFTVKKGDIVPIIGENGTGKTLLMKVLAGEMTGILENTEIEWGGVDMRRMSADLHRRSWKIVTSSENDSLRDLLASALLYKGGLRSHTLGFEIDKEKMMQWAQGKQEYSELENAVTSRLKEWGISIHASESWHKFGLRPSGMQRAIANLSFHCLVDEPLNLLIDEAGGELDSKRIDDYIRLLQARSLANELPGAVFVAINKDVGKWMLATQSAFIDTRDVVQGHVVESGLGSEELSEKLGADIAREYHAMFELNQPMSPDQFIAWITYGPGKEFDTRAAEVKKECYTRQPAQNFDGFDHVKYIRESGVIEFESGPYSQYLKTCLTYWFEEFSRIAAKSGGMSNSAIDTHLSKTLEALNVFYGRDLRAGEWRYYIRNMNGSVIDNPDGRWNHKLHERVFGNILKTYLLGHVRKLERAMGYHATSEREQYKHYPQTFDERYDLLESLLMMENLFEITNAYCPNVSSSSAPFGDVPDLARRVNSIDRERRHYVMAYATPSYQDLCRYIIDDPLVLYDLSHETNPPQVKWLKEYFSLVLPKLNRDQLETTRRRLIEIKMPTKSRGVKVYKSFWNIVNTNEVEEVETGWLRTLFDKRLATLLS